MSLARLTVFSLAASIAYIAAYYFNWPLFRYFPETMRFGLSAPPAPVQTVLWYGWLANGIIAGAIVALIVPKRLAARLSPDLLWQVPVVLVLAVLIYERRWFL